MYRLTSDVEKLPFPMAPVGAQGITALADASGGQETWRWRVFSFGAVLGLVFGAVYLALPAITGAFLPEAISIFPIPFKDLTNNTESFLPAVPVMISFDLMLVISGMVLPYSAMVGGLIGLAVGMIANPILYHYGILHTWVRGVGALSTINANTLDFYLSFSLGLTAAIAFIGFYQVYEHLFKKRDDLRAAGTAKVDWRQLFNPPAGRGDISIWIAVGLYIFSTLLTITTAYFLLNHAHLSNPANSAVTKTLMVVLMFYGFVYTPIIGYVSARMEGIIGHERERPLRSRGDIHPHRLQRRRHLVRAIPRLQLRQPDLLLPANRTHRHKNHQYDQGRGVHPAGGAGRHAGLQPVYLAHCAGAERRVSVCQPILGTDAPIQTGPGDEQHAAGW